MNPYPALPDAPYRYQAPPPMALVPFSGEQGTEDPLPLENRYQLPLPYQIPREIPGQIPYGLEIPFGFLGRENGVPMEQDSPPPLQIRAPSYPYRVDGTPPLPKMTGSYPL